MRLVLAKTVYNYMENAKTSQEAVEQALKLVNRRMASTYKDIGVIAVDTHGRIGAAHNSPNLCWSYMAAKEQKPVAYLTAQIVK